MINSQKRPVKKWLAFGHYGGDNTGDEAMLMGLISGVERISNIQLHVVYKGKFPEPFRELGIATIQPKILPVLFGLINCYGVVLGGGTHFQDDMSLRRYLRHVRYMLRYVAISLFSKIIHKKVLWISMGFGPFYRTPSRWITKIGLRCCDYVTVRESNSARVVRDWIKPNKIKVSFDLAALLLKQGDLFIEKEINLYNPTLGISATSVKNTKSGGQIANEIFWDKFINVVRQVIQEHQNLKIKIFVFRGGDRESDVEISYRIYDSLNQFSPGNIELVPYNPNPMKTLKMISNCQSFISTRFHSGILAYLAQCRQIFIVYHHKLFDLANELGYDDQSVMWITTDYSENLIKEKINKLLITPNNFMPTLKIQEALQRAKISIEILKMY